MKIVDERILQCKHKIYAEMCLILRAILILSVLIKVLFLGQHMQDCLLEYGLFLATTLYQGVRTRQQKISMLEQDEREVLVKEKIDSDIFLCAYYVVVLSFLLKTLLAHQSLADCATEFIILIGTPLYQTVRSRQLGVVLTPNPRAAISWKRNVAAAVLGLIVLAAALFFTETPAKPMDVMVSIGTYVICFVAHRALFVRVEEKRMKKLEQEFDEE